MFFKSNVGKLLREYPRMWGVKSKWSDGDELKLGRLTEEMLRQKCDDTTTWWAMVDYASIQEIFRLDATPDVSLGNAALREFPNGFDVVNLVSQVENTFTIWRAPRGTTIRKVVNKIFSH